MKFQLISRLAWQTFIRNKSQFIFSIFGFALSVLLFVVIMTLGMQSRKSVDSVLTNTGTHFIAFKPQCCENPFFAEESEEGFVAQGIVSQPLPYELIKGLNELESVADASPFLSYRLEQEDGPVIVGGFDPANRTSVASTSCSATDLITGRFLEEGDQDVIMIEQAFSVARGVGTGMTYEISGHPFRVVGVVNPGIRPAKTDVYMTWADAQRLLTKETGIAVPNLMNIILVESAGAYMHTQAMRDVEARVGSAGLISTYGCYKPASKAMTAHTTFIRFISIFVFVFALLLALKTQSSTLYARRRDLGILCSMGWTKWDLSTMIVVESMIQSILGGLLGCGLTLLLVRFFPWQSMGAVLDLPGFAIWRLLGFAMGYVVIGGGLAGSLPAWHVTRGLPASQLRTS